MANRFKESLKATSEAPNKAGSTSIFQEAEEDINKSNINSINNSKTKNNILDTVLSQEEQRGKNVAFYISAEVDEAITRLSKQNKISKSKLVDNILKQVLFKSQ